MDAASVSAKRWTQKRWVGAAAVVLAVPVGWALVRWMASGMVAEATGAHMPRAFCGVRLGMVPEQVRAQFDVDDAGRWRMVMLNAGEGAFEWRAASREEGAAGVTDARFEFHGGVLVAVRATFAARGEMNVTEIKPVLYVRDASVWEVAASSGDVSYQGNMRLRWIARDCPVHAEEVRQMLAAKTLVHSSKTVEER